MNLHLIGRGAFVAMVVIAILATAYWFGPRCSENAPSAAIGERILLFGCPSLPPVVPPHSPSHPDPLLTPIR
jgi:hypothetical protein